MSLVGNRQAQREPHREAGTAAPPASGILNLSAARRKAEHGTVEH